MKIVRIDTGNAAFLMADSAWRPHRRPYFVPEGTAPLCEIRPALRIDRLGKAINPKFADRYIGAWTPVCYMRPAADYEGLAPAGMLDDSMIIGEWLPVPRGSVALTLDGHTTQWGLDSNAAASLLASLSQAATFKTGDVIVLPQVLFSFTPVAGNSVELSVSDTKVLEYNIR